MTIPGTVEEWIPVQPGYGSTTLGAVLPGVAATLGAPTVLAGIDLPAADRVCVVLVDGLGQALLAENASDAPFLATLTGSTLRVGCPTTTATSMGSFGTGLHPGQHGLVGYQVMDPERGVLLNELKWDPEVDPHRWQPYPTVFQHLTSAGITCTSIGNPEFSDSGLTEAALRGARFIGVDKLHDRVDVTVAALREPGLAYLYWGQVDGAGHLYGAQSRNWRRALREIDEAIKRLARLLPQGTLLLVTADHGMIDVPHRVSGGPGGASRPSTRASRYWPVRRASPRSTVRPMPVPVWPNVSRPHLETGPGCGPAPRRSRPAGSGLSTSESSGGSGM